MCQDLRTVGRLNLSSEDFQFFLCSINGDWVTGAKSTADRRKLQFFSVSPVGGVTLAQDEVVTLFMHKRRSFQSPAMKSNNNWSRIEDLF